jgi:hypothetical protein
LAEEVNVGSLGDSFYEYLLKVWIYEGGQTLPSKLSERTTFDDAMQVGPCTS